MREWALSSNDPLALTLAFDARIGPTDYANDHIWELTFGKGEPPGVVIETTFGLRARAFRILPRFSEKDLIVTNPGDFARAPLIRLLFPNFVTMDFLPFPEIDVSAEYWVPEPYALAGRFSITNKGETKRIIRLDILGQLAPTEGQRMAPQEVQAAWVLAGQTADLFPVLFLTGGPQTGAGSFPSLCHSLELLPGESRQIGWSLGATHSLECSFDLARKTAARRWDAERAYLEMLNSGDIEIYTGNPDWDTAFMLSQHIAHSLVAGPTAHLPEPSFVLTRRPDQGYSRRGDGSDYNHLWNGQSALDACYLGSILLPNGLNLIRGLLINFLSVQEEDGSIDWRPGLAGQRSFILSTPMLSILAWKIYEIDGDAAFIGQVFLGLLRFFQTWFHSDHDRDKDGIPEWDHPSQFGSEDHPYYSRWHDWSKGIDISTAESPALCSFLYRECQALIEMAGVAGYEEEIPGLTAIAERLRLMVEITWNPANSCYPDVDRDTHYSASSEQLAEQIGTETIKLNRKFPLPIRLLIHISSSDGMHRRPELTIRGTSATGQPRLERLGGEKFKWLLGRGVYTGDRNYQAIDRIEISGIQAEDKIQIHTAGYDFLDLATLLPLWAGIPDAERAEAMQHNLVTNPARFWRPAGLPGCLEAPLVPEALVCQSVNMIWNNLIGEGLVRYGFRETAAELITRLMNTIITNLKQHRAFRLYYHAETGTGSGEFDPLQGLAPLGLFLETLGIRFVQPDRVYLVGFNPFPWPITVKYRGISVLKMKDKSMVVFPKGQTITVEDPKPQIIALEPG